MKTVSIFETNVLHFKDAKAIISLLEMTFPHYRLNFDLSDCDHILRVESKGGNINIDEIEIAVKAMGYTCMHLP
ncbi:hypothetical protein [Chitinophaga sp. CF118]|uniref:hypothetical protein n=1 Tax=Chitinophaga sp. CF118 TaxID=1884367 RepID=UPI0011604331|nr:hypothetical protein [Chitinophaga sp. CF118]